MDTLPNDTSEHRLGLVLVAIRIDPNTEGRPDLYSFDVDSERPLISNGLILMFDHPSLGDIAISKDDDPLVRASGPAPTTYFGHNTIDLPMMMYRVSEESNDPNATIIEGINFILDMLKAIPGRDWVKPVKRVLFPFADHVTFSKRYDDYFNEHRGHRQKVLDALYWSVGVIVAHTTVIRTNETESEQS
jgi:hypothetical protein